MSMADYQTMVEVGVPMAMVGFAEYAKVPVTVATRLPQVLSMTDGALIEPLAISLYGVKLAQIEAREQRFKRDHRAARVRNDVRALHDPQRSRPWAGCRRGGL